MIIANFKSNLLNFDRWVDDYVNSCQPVEFYVGIAPPSVYINEYSNGTVSYTHLTLPTIGYVYI